MARQVKEMDEQKKAEHEARVRKQQEMLSSLKRDRDEVVRNLQALVTNCLVAKTENGTKGKGKD